MENAAKKILEGLDEEKHGSGTYETLEKIRSHLVDELQMSGMLFSNPKESSTRFKSGASRHWPNHRGIFHNNNNDHWRKNGVCWVNEEDHGQYL